MSRRSSRRTRTSARSCRRWRRQPRSTANTGSLNLILPRNERALSADEIIQELRPKLAAVPGILACRTRRRSASAASRHPAQYQYTLQSTDLNELYHWTERCSARFRQLPGFVDVTSNLNNQRPSSKSRLTATRSPATDSVSRRSRTHCRAPLAAAPDLDDLRRGKPVPGDP